MKKINYPKLLLFSLCLGLTITGLLTAYSATVTTCIASQVLRLHVLANSDTYEDQSLKLQVRDRVLAYLADEIPKPSSLAESRTLLTQQLPNIIAVAQDELSQSGCDYPVTASIGTFNFPTKTYDGFALPAGRYEALQIRIGEAAGQNWWCVLYPNICGTGKNTDMEQVLSKDDYKMVTKPRLKFKIVEFFSKKQ